MSYYTNNRVSSVLNAVGAFVLVVCVFAALAAFIYMRFLYATGEISAEDYARMSGQTPRVVILK